MMKGARGGSIKPLTVFGVGYEQGCRDPARATG